LSSNTVFKLAQQLVGIQLAASLVFRFWGKIKTRGVRFHHGKQSVFWLSVAISLGGLIVLASFQNILKTFIYFL